jgi:hypothetical protein
MDRTLITLMNLSRLVAGYVIKRGNNNIVDFNKLIENVYGINLNNSRGMYVVLSDNINNITIPVESLLQNPPTLNGDYLHVGVERFMIKHLRAKFTADFIINPDV